MDRQLTTVDILGTLFEVDAYREVLKQKDDPSNRIPFHVFDQKGDGYTFLYDTERKNVPENKQSVVDNPDRYRWVSIIALMELDPEGIALRYEIPIEILVPENKSIIPKTVVAEIRPLRIKAKTA
ncbi:hypothetical protein JHJ32_07420 [Parapedobacter sp. ISTM3]|uniref:hypothetical protein n=1 Tax=Parapedobacter sp. ISTM3 TaxID=2800130 RepID=UPI0019056EF2|nr:hypothetical protein [Parapedobacter sp. ISTM3]MBK1439807.1 hypothetical protein [Parapedobacter sp. ISTM3]